MRRALPPSQHNKDTENLTVALDSFGCPFNHKHCLWGAEALATTAMQHHQAYYRATPKTSNHCSLKLALMDLRRDDGSFLYATSAHKADISIGHFIGLHSNGVS
jgi:ectoine hydroxylase-related dioxygenase (phytanoyl-CoA dioxygenase family)